VWGDEPTTPSPELLGEIKAAHERREVALELLESDEEAIAPFPLQATLDDDPEALAERLRLALEIDSEVQSDWDDERVAFNTWRFSVENLGALVLQMTEVKSGEARGFSIAERTVPVVVANNKDPFVARSFTVVHELVHVAIRQSGICDLRTDHGRVERFCNRVAGAMLVPAGDLLADDVVVGHGSRVDWRDDELVRLARRFKASREVVLRRLLLLGRTDGAFYRRKRKQLQEEYERRAAEPKETGPIPPSTKAVIRSGHSCARLVLSSYSHRLITASDVASYLGVRMKHVPKIESDVFHRGA
jgi:Zn-dependent peptidase ImmA (M78 family)